MYFLMSHYTVSGPSTIKHNIFDFNGLNNNQILSANISQTLIILSMIYNGGDANATSSVYANGPTNIGPT